MSQSSIPHYIFPNATELIRLKQYAKSPEFKKSLSTSQLAGQWQSIFKGRSMDFEEVRVYQSGDDIRNIDWNISAKTGELHTRIYKQEKERPVLIMVDYSPSMHFGTRKKYKCSLAAEIASILAFSLVNKGDRVGGLIFDRSSHKEIRPKMQMAGVLQLIHHLSVPLEPSKAAEQGLNQSIQSKLKSKAYGNEANQGNQVNQGLSSAIKRMARLAKPGMVIFIISDFLEFNQSIKKQLIRMAEHCQVNLCMIYDPLERNLPDLSSSSQNEFVIESEGEKFRIQSTELERKNHQAYFDQRLSEIENFAKRKRFTFSLLSTDDDLAKFNIKIA